jgi:hypothetical protein
MVSEDALRKLLDEFVEKEALVREEIKVVQDEITQLEERLQTCRDRLSTLGTDREKVLSMRTRYLEGDFSAAPPVFEMQTAPGLSQAVAAAESALAQAQASSRQAPKQPTNNEGARVPAATISEPPAAEPSHSNWSDSGAEDNATEPAAPAPQPAQPGSQPMVQPVQPADPAATAAPAVRPRTVMDAPPGAPNVRASRTGLAAILGGRARQEETPPIPRTEPAESQAAVENNSAGGLDSYLSGTAPARLDAQEEQAEQQPEISQEEPEKVVDIESNNNGESEDDTVKSINDALRNLFR